MQANLPSQARFRGCLLGLAVGDALGTTLEFSSPGTFHPLVDMIGGGPFRLQAGQWTDDTSMALCLAESLVERNGFDPDDQMQRYLRWWRQGYNSSTGVCFDIGGTTRSALVRYERTSKPFSGSSEPHTAGNGSLMRLAPMPMLAALHPEAGIKLCGDSSRTTHAEARAVDACRFFGGLLISALNGTPKQDLLVPRFAPTKGYWEQNRLHPDVLHVAEGSYLDKQPPEIRGSSYVIHTLEAALWALARTDSFVQGALLVVNLGEDADTTGAVYGQIAGAVYGVENIPASWREKLALREKITNLADRLWQLSRTFQPD